MVAQASRNAQGVPSTQAAQRASSANHRLCACSSLLGIANKQQQALPSSGLSRCGRVQILVDGKGGPGPLGRGNHVQLDILDTSPATNTPVMFVRPSGSQIRPFFSS